MTKHLLPPRPGQQLSNTKGRVHDLERRLARAIPEQRGYLAKFSLAGTLFVSESGYEMHPYGGRLILVYATLVVAGDDTTVLSIRKNDAEFAELKLPATRRYNEYVTSTEFAARADTLQVAITTVGANAESLTVFGLFDR
jgi:hypothetical protein